MAAYAGNLVVAAHKSSSNHRAAVVESDGCGCFYCLEVFAPSAIVDWVDNETTALCPKCGIDSVIGEKSGFPVKDRTFLQAMHEH